MADLDFIDLKTQYRRIKPAVDARIARVLEHGKGNGGGIAGSREHPGSEEERGERRHGESGFSPSPAHPRAEGGDVGDVVTGVPGI